MIRKQVVILQQWEVPNNKRFSPRYTAQKFTRNITAIYDYHGTSHGLARINGQFVPVYLAEVVWCRLWLEDGKPNY